MNVDDLKKRFKHHPPKDSDQIERYATVRNELLNLAIKLDELTGGLDSREKSTAVTKMEEAMFWWNAHIARSGNVPAEIYAQPYPITSCGDEIIGKNCL